MTKRVKNGEVNACQTLRSKLRVRAFFSWGGRAGGWRMARERERKIWTRNKVQSFVFLQLKDALEQDCCQLWKTIFLWKKYASNNGFTRTEPVCPICIYSTLCKINCLEHHAFRSVLSIGEPNLALISWSQISFCITESPGCLITTVLNLALEDVTYRLGTVLFKYDKLHLLP